MVPSRSLFLAVVVATTACGGGSSDDPTCQLADVQGGDNCGCVLDLPVDPATLVGNDTFWPYGVHGGGHPEGHRGWDFISNGGTADVVAPGDGRIFKLDDGSSSEYVEGISMYALLDCGIQITFQPVVLDDGLDVGSTFTKGQHLGHLAQLKAQFGADRFSMHFDTRVASDDSEQQIQCALPFFDATDTATLNALVDAVTYDEKVARTSTFDCSDGTTMDFDLPAETMVCNPHASQALADALTACLMPGPGRAVW